MDSTESDPPKNLGEARDRYIQRSTLKSPHTVAAYDQSIACFIDFLNKTMGKGALPIQRSETPADEIKLETLAPGDAPLLLAFAEWQLSESTDPDDSRPYAPATVKLRISGVSRWLQWLDDYGWLPPAFPLSKCQRMVRDELQSQRKTHTGAPEPPRGIEELLTFYQDQRPPKRLQNADKDDPEYRHWELVRLRNHALVKALAESGGRVSEVLSLNISDFAPRDLQPPYRNVVRVRVTGKGRHEYDLRLHQALEAISEYIEARGLELIAERGQVPLFVSHDARAIGKRLSRTTAWRVVTQAARGLGLRSIHPHDLRHWRATQLVNKGQPLDVVQDYLGHRSVETTRAYYARTDPRRVDQAALNTPIDE